MRRIHSVGMGRIAIIVLVILSLIIGVGIGYYVHPENEPTRLEIPQETINIAGNISIIVKESDTKNRTLLLNSSNPYCRITTFIGGTNPYPWDLAEPNATIVFFFLEDIEDSSKADNYGDLIIRMNPIVKDGARNMVIVFFAEGGYDKFVYYKDELLYHYTDPDNTTNYGIREIPIG